MKKYLAAAAIIVVFAAGRLEAAVKIHPDAGTTSAAFLKVGAGARSSALAGAFTAAADDATAVYWNPAALVALDRPEAVAAHNESFEGIRHDYIGFAGGKYGVYRWGAAFTALYTPADIERRSGLNEDDPFEPVTSAEGYFAAYDAALSFAAARSVGRRMSAGAALKIINQTIDDSVGWGVGADAGIRYDCADDIVLAAVIRNFGTPIAVGSKSYPLPFSLRTGAAYTSALGRTGKIRTSAEASFPTDNYPSFHFGTEYMPTEMFALRAGYRYRVYGLELGDLSGLAVGAGMKISAASGDFMLDYSFNPHGVLGNSHRITLSAAFGRKAPAAPASAGKKTAAPAAPARREVSLPAPPPSEAVAVSAPVESEFTPAEAVFTPGMVSPAGVTGTLAAGPLAGGIKSFTATMSARGAPQVSLKTASRDSDGGDYTDYYLRADTAGRITGVTVIIETPRRIKSAHPLGGMPTEGGISVAEAGGQSPYVYEIMTGALRDFRVTYE